MNRGYVLLSAAVFWGCTASRPAGGPGNAGASGSAGGPETAGTTGTAGSSGAIAGGTGEVSGTGGRSAIPATGGTTAAGGSVMVTGGSGGASGTSGSGGAGLSASYFMGADITDEETQPEATRANLLTLMKAHGFNYVRLRTFVDPRAADGYDKNSGFDDLAHTVAFGKQIKDAGLGLLVDFHYSDSWADPGKQCVPVAWQSLTTIAELATAVHDYTRDAITKLTTGGARPDVVQLGNESTPGILIHLCDAAGHPRAGIAGYSPINGALYLYSSTDGGAPPAGGPAAGGWANLGLLLNAGARGVKDVDTGIQIALHLDRGNDLASSRNFIQNASTRGVPFDVFAESCYTVTQGQPADWQATFAALAASFPDLKFMIAEYSGAQRAANDVMFNLSGQRGTGAFNWQPTNLWTRSGGTYGAQPSLAIYDQMKIDYAARL